MGTGERGAARGINVGGAGTWKRIADRKWNSRWKKKEMRRKELAVVQLEL